MLGVSQVFLGFSLDSLPLCYVFVFSLKVALRPCCLSACFVYVFPLCSLSLLVLFSLVVLVISVVSFMFPLVCLVLCQVCLSVSPLISFAIVFCLVFSLCAPPPVWFVFRWVICCPPVLACLACPATLFREGVLSHRGHRGPKDQRQFLTDVAPQNKGVFEALNGVY